MVIYCYTHIYFWHHCVSVGTLYGYGPLNLVNQHNSSYLSINVLD